MAKLPVIDGSTNIDTGISLSRDIRANNDTARALSNFGEQITEFGVWKGQRLQNIRDKQAADMERTAKWGHERDLLNLQNEAKTDLDARAENISNTGEGFTKAYASGLTAKLQGWLDSLPADQRSEYEVKAASLQNQLLDRASSIELSQRRNFLGNLITDKVKSLGEASASGYDLASSRHDADSFVTNLGLPPNAAARVRHDLGLAIDSGRLEALMKANPGAVVEQLKKYIQTDVPAAGATPAQNAIVDQAQLHGIDPRIMLMLAGRESAFNPDAKNPKSSAYGLFQFLDKTWAQTGIGKTNDPVLQAAAASILVKRYADRLGSAGVTAKPGDIWGMHILGPEGYMSVLGASKDEPFVDAYARAAGYDNAQRAVAANPILAGTVGQALGRIHDAAQEMYTSTSSLLTTQVSPGGDQPIQINGETLDALTPADVAPIFGKARDLMRQSVDKAVNKLQAKRVDDGIINPDDPADRTELNKHALANNVPALFEQADPAGLAAAMGYVNQYGILPAPIGSAATRMLTSTDTARRNLSIELLATVHARDPVRGLSRAGIIGDAKKTVDQTVAYASAYGVPLSTALDHVQRSMADDFKLRSKKDADHINSVVSRSNWGEVAGRLGVTDGSWWSANQVGLDIVKKHIMENYSDAVRFHLNEGLSDDRAKAMALQDTQQGFGFSEVSGTKRFMRYPVEGVYPKVGGTHDYIRTQLTEYVNGVLARSGANYKADPSKIVLVGKAQTGQDLIAGNAPRYDVWFTDQTGTPQIIPGLWAPDVGRAYRDQIELNMGGSTDAPPPAIDPSIDVTAAKTAARKRREPQKFGGRRGR